MWNHLVLCVDFEDPQILKFTRNNDIKENINKQISKNENEKNDNENENNNENENENENDLLNNSKTLKSNFFDNFDIFQKSKNTITKEHSSEEEYSSEHLERGKRGRDMESTEDNFTGNDDVIPSQPTANSIYTIKLAVNGRMLECRKFCTFSPDLTRFVCPIDRMRSDGGSHNNSINDINSCINNNNNNNNNDNNNINNNNNNYYNNNNNIDDNNVNIKKHDVTVSKSDDNVNTIQITHSSSSTSMESFSVTINENQKINNVSNNNNNNDNDNDNDMDNTSNNTNNKNSHNNNKNNNNNKSLDLGNLSDLLTLENNNLPKIVTPRNEIKVNKELIFGFYDSLTNCCFEGYVRSFRVYCSPHRLRKYPKNGIKNENDELLGLKENEEKKEIKMNNNGNHNDYDYDEEDIYSVKYLNKLQLPCISNSNNNSKDNINNNNINNKNGKSNDEKNRSNYITIENSTNTNTNTNTKKATTTTKSTSTTNLNNEYDKSINKNKSKNKNKNKNRIKNHFNRFFLNKKPCINIIPRKPIGPILTKNAIYAVLHDLPANKIILSNNCGHSGQYRGKLVNKW